MTVDVIWGQEKGETQRMVLLGLLIQQTVLQVEVSRFKAQCCTSETISTEVYSCSCSCITCFRLHLEIKILHKPVLLCPE